MQHDLVDEYVLSIHPLVLGSGRRLFPDGVPCTTLNLIDSKMTTTGVVMATIGLPPDKGGPDSSLLPPR
jgi:dihydrofolate reductase